MAFSESIPWLVAIIGWASTHLFSEARERRKEVRSQIDKVYEQIYKLEEDSRKFHCSENFDASIAGTILSKITILEKSIRRIPIINPETLKNEIIALRRSITLSNFDKSTFQAQTQDSPVLGSIYDANSNLENRIEDMYWANYKPQFPYFSFKAIRSK